MIAWNIYIAWKRLLMIAAIFGRPSWNKHPGERCVASPSAEEQWSLGRPQQSFPGFVQASAAWGAHFWWSCSRDCAWSSGANWHFSSAYNRVNAKCSASHCVHGLENKVMVKQRNYLNFAEKDHIWSNVICFPTENCLECWTNSWYSLVSRDICLIDSFVALAMPIFDYFNWATRLRHHDVYIAVTVDTLTTCTTLPVCLRSMNISYY